MQQEMLRSIHSWDGKMQKKSHRCYVLAWDGCSDPRHHCKLPHLQCSPTKQYKGTNDSTRNPDLFEISNQKYLVMVDYYSSFIEINLLSNGTTSKQIVTHFKSQFSGHGIPDTLITDNGPQFSSTTFKQFSRDYGFQHKHYPQSNSMAEKAVQTTKNLIKKAILDKRDPYLAFLEYRNAPISDTLGLPVQRLIGRRTKTLLPTTKKLLQPKLINPLAAHKELRERKAR